MATYLSAVNSVLRRLREREVTSVNATFYSRLVGELINDVKREVEDTHNWTHLRNTIQISTQPGVFRYSLVGAGRRFRLLEDPMGNPAVFNDTDDVYVHKAPNSRWMTRHLNHNNVESGRPKWFDINGYNEDGDPIVDLYQIPDAVYELNFDVAIPQDDFSTSGSNDNTQIKVPEQPVILGAWSRAIYERGEDNGYLSDLANRDYQTALSDAIAWDSSNSSDEKNWYVV